MVFKLLSTLSVLKNVRVITKLEHADSIVSVSKLRGVGEKEGEISSAEGRVGIKRRQTKEMAKLI